MTPHSIWLQSTSHYGVIGDTSLSTGQLYLSMSLWIKVTGAGATLCGNEDIIDLSTRGWGIQIQHGDPPGTGDGQIEWSYTTGVSNIVYGLVTNATNIIDGNWHNLITTYDGTGVEVNCTAVTDSTHLTVASTAGMLAGDQIRQTFYGTTITSVVDGTHLVVGSTAGFTTGNVDTRGLIIYLDGVAFTTMNDYEYPALGANYSSTIPFGIGGNSGGLTGPSRIAKYAYPALYYSVLTPAQVAFISSGHNLPGNNLQAQYLFTEGTGTTAADASGNGHTMTFNVVDSWSTDVPFLPSSHVSTAKKTSMLSVI
jgi:hypothetical protein